MNYTRWVSGACRDDWQTLRFHAGKISPDFFKFVCPSIFLWNKTHVCSVFATTCISYSYPWKLRLCGQEQLRGAFILWSGLLYFYCAILLANQLVCIFLGQTMNVYKIHTIGGCKPKMANRFATEAPANSDKSNTCYSAINVFIITTPKETKLSYRKQK